MQRHLNGDGVFAVIDVGSVGWLPEPWDKPANVRRIRRILRFDPGESTTKTANSRTVNHALWSENCMRTLYIPVGTDAGSSLYPQDYEYVREHYDEIKEFGDPSGASTWFKRSAIRREVQIACRRLDDVLAEIDEGETYNVMKIDVQGAEHECLRGAEGFLRRHCLCVHVETSTIPLFKGAKLQDEVIAYMDELGFSLVRTYPPHGTFNSQNDCVFFRRGGAGPLMDVLSEIYDVRGREAELSS